MAAVKRQASASFSGNQSLVKRQKSNPDLKDTTTLVARGPNGQNQSLVPSVLRTSGLQAPILELTGHGGEIFAARFDSTGQHIASGSMDRSILLWNTYGESNNYGVMTGHRGAVLDLQWARDSKVLYSASADTTIASWDLESGLRIRKHTGHDELVNCLEISRRGSELLISGSDDGSIGVWDPRQKAAVNHIETDFPVTAVALAEAGNEIYSGGIDNDIKVWDARTMEVVYTMKGHSDTVTSLEVSPDSQSLLSNSHDSTARTWDVRPFAPIDRSMQTFDGAPTGFEKNLIRASWSSKGDKICAGSGDRTVVVWDARSAKLLYKLPGHKGTVNDVRFSPSEESIIVSASTDRNILLGELGK